MAKPKNKTNFCILPGGNIITRKLPYKVVPSDNGLVDFVNRKGYNFTGAYHVVYNRTDEIADKTFVSDVMEKYSLTTIEYRSVENRAKAARLAEEELKELYNADIEYYTDLIEDPETDPSERWKCFRKRANLLKILNFRNATFGKRSIMRKITRYSNDLIYLSNQIPLVEKELEDLKKTDVSGFDRRCLSLYNRRLEKKSNELEKLNKRKEFALVNIPKLKEQFRENRFMGFTILGEANQNGNRFFNFDLVNGSIEAKLTHEGKHKFSFKVPYNFKKEFAIVQKLIDEKSISVTVTIDKEYIYSSYDYSIVSGYAIDEKARRADVKEIKKEEFPEEIQKEKIRELYKDYYDNQKERMLGGKISGRCIAVDLNPGDIGWVVMELDNKSERGYRIVDCGRISWSGLMNRNHWKSTWERSKKKNRQRKHAVYEAIKLLFKIAVHYKCSEFIQEDSWHG